MKRFLYAMLIAALLLPSCGRKPAALTDDRLAVIFETDLGNDVDDALALDLLYR